MLSLNDRASGWESRRRRNAKAKSQNQRKQQKGAYPGQDRWQLPTGVDAGPATGAGERVDERPVGRGRSPATFAAQHLGSTCWPSSVSQRRGRDQPRAAARRGARWSPAFMRRAAWSSARHPARRQRGRYVDVPRAAGGPPVAGEDPGGAFPGRARSPNTRRPYTGALRRARRLARRLAARGCNPRRLYGRGRAPASASTALAAACFRARLAREPSDASGEAAGARRRERRGGGTSRARESISPPQTFDPRVAPLRRPGPRSR